jgi:transcription-repair coupling factor (superfamily II helicase)
MAKLGFLGVIEQSPYFKNKLSQIKSAQRTAFSGLIGSSRAAILSVLSKEMESLLIISATSAAAENLKREIELLSGKAVQFFPALDFSPGEGILPDKQLTGQRLEILDQWVEGKKITVVAPLKAVTAKTVSRSKIIDRKLEIRVSDRFELEDLIGRLVRSGYQRFDIVGESGEFSVRGGIVDIFPLNSLHPFRLELAGDRIESLRGFDPYSQRSSEKVPGIHILPAAEEREASVLEYLPKGSLIVLDELIELRRACEEKDLAYLDEIQKEARIELSSFLAEGEETAFSSPPSYINRFEAIPDRSFVVSRHAARLKEEFPEKNIIPGELRGGFIFEGLEVIADKELFGEEAVSRKPVKAGREGVADELLSDLTAGDFVVHENYGIGIYRGMKSLEIEEGKQEYLLIEYAGGDKLFVPPHMIGLVEKYNGGGVARPRLSHLGTREWLRTRNRVKQSLRDLTGELLEIYAAREKMEGYAFPPDDVWQKELEGTFPYEETPDQIKAINDVKKDMGSARPMDRLVCGDVGYGKTEVAIRAAAKAVSAGKQVAVLAPTTILVEQHYNNFKQRYKNLPFVIEMLSRFRSPKEQKQVVQRLESGGGDIVIGTHRLLSKDIKFKDLGLLIVDEEQKFGVSHKERLKKLKKTVDVLTLTATPIPRTLYFSLSGVREMSMIGTPPVDRSPIRTYVIPYSETVIREAIRRELDRVGQVYFVHNFVETIAGTASKIKRLVPEAKVGVGHGQMPEKELEKTMLDFLDRKFDVLVCTSIIESGLDIPNVNTILIDHADRFGLSQIYQIRGRVGRSAARAYAYLFYHPARSMTDQAVERLKAIQEFTALGSGYKLAMRDLEIRGSGNLLGAEQSGHIYEVGFDLYVELLEEAVKELKGETVLSPREVEIDLKVEASIPPAYVADDRQRIALYRRMNLITTPEGVEDMKKELADRFGRPPSQVETLLRILQLKVAALKAGVKSIKEEKGRVEVEWLSGKRKTTDKYTILKTGIP